MSVARKVKRAHQAKDERKRNRRIAESNNITYNVNPKQLYGIILRKEEENYHHKGVYKTT